MNRFARILMIACIALGASPVYAQQATSTQPFEFQRQGIFGCSMNGAYSMSVGAMAAIGGVYVPVNDAAVTLNTGFLVYKECVLRGVVDREREAAMAAIDKGIQVNFLTGRDGRPMYPQNLAQDKLEERDRVFARDLQNGTLDTLNPAFASAVKRAIARGYMNATRKPNSVLSCNFDDLENTMEGNPQGSVWSSLSQMRDPACNPFFATGLAGDLMEKSGNSAVDDMMNRLQWANGVYDVSSIDENGNRVVLTPGTAVKDIEIMSLQSGYKQLQSANDIDQMVGALYAGIASQAVGDIRGLAGLTQQNGTNPSYLDKVAAESQQGLRNAAANAALQILTAAKQIEGGYNQIMRAIRDVLAQTVNALRGKEDQCWGLIISKVCTSAPDSQKKCTSPNGDQLKVSTSTAFSAAVISARISPLASTTQQNIDSSNRAMTLIDQLIAGVTNTASIDAQRIALQQLDSLVYMKKLHTQNDLSDAQQSQTAVTNSMNSLVQDTLTSWGDSMDPSVGWCNVNNQSVVQMWISRWKI